MSNPKPNLNDFADVLELLAERYSRVEGQGEQSADWVRSAIGSADTKLGALRFILERSSPEYKPRLLDIGSQIGSLPLYATRLGIEAAAVDNAELAPDWGRILREYGVDYRVGDIGKDHLPFGDAAFDFVTYMDVIEHHEYSPKRVLLEVWRVLAPGGCVIVTTPNHASIYNRFSLLTGRSVNDSFDYFSKLRKTSACTWGTIESTRASSCALLLNGRASGSCDVLRSMKGSGRNGLIFAEPVPAVGFRRFEDREDFLPPTPWDTYGLLSRSHSAEYYGPQVRRLMDHFDVRSSKRDTK